MAMPDCYYVREQKLEDAVDVQRLLPPEILVEIGIADHAASRRQCSSHAVVEELAARLVGILGLTSAGGVRERGGGAASAPPPTSATPPYSHHPHAHRSHVQEHQHLAGGGANGSSQGMVQYHHYHAPGFGANQWLPPPIPTTFVPSPASSFAGTGVFLPRAEVYLTRASNPPRINGAKPPRLLRKEAAVRNKIN